jgi:hypothetical protein
VKFESQAAKDAARAEILDKLIAAGLAVPTKKRSTMLLGKRIPYLLPKHYGTSLPGRQRGDPNKPILDKHDKYRRRLKAEGKCQRCGTPCAPYALCVVHRFLKRESRRK